MKVSLFEIWWKCFRITIVMKLNSRERENSFMLN